MYNTNNNRPAYYMPQQPAYLGIKGRPVASIEEARASIIDFDGSIFFFPDLANKRIYTKQINMDGTAQLNVYELKEIPQDISSTQYITREEFEAVIAQLRGQVAPAESPVPAQQRAVPTVPLNF